MMPEGYSVYRRVMADLKSIGGRASKAARMNAVLLARHADLYAKVIAEKTGKKFTALDYYHTFMVQAGREGDVTGGLNQKETEKEKEAVRKQYAGTAQWMKAPNGKATNLTEDQWLTVRTPAFKAWFGDWEVANAIEFALHGDPVTSLTGKEFQPDGVRLTDKVPLWYKAHFNGVATNPELGEVKLDLEGVKDSMGHGMGREKAAAYAAVPYIIEHGIVYDRQMNWKQRGYDTAVIVAPIKFAGQDYIGEVVVKRQPNRQGFYLHEVEIQKKLENAFKTPTKGGAPQASRLIIADHLAKFNGCSKIVDGNGEPLVVYHQTSNTFDSFDVRHEGAGRNDSETPYGVFLKPNAEDLGFGDIQMPLFTHIRNPLRFQNREQLARWAKKEVDGYAELADRLQALDADYEKRSDTAEQQENELYEEMWKAQERGELSDEEYEAKAAELEEHGEWGRILKEWQETTAAVRHDMKELLDAVVRASGHDGFLLDTDAGAFGRKVPTIVALTPWQVKSATDNNGVFSADDTNIYHQRAWVGSAADFDKFDLGYIGTGEGAQVHGYGLYSAQGRNVAEGYKEKLSALLNEAEGDPVDYNYVEVIQFNGYRYEKPEGYDLWTFEPGTADEVYIDDPGEDAVLEKLNEVQDVDKARAFFEEELEAKRRGEWGATEYSEDTLEKAVAMLSPDNIYDEAFEVSTEEPPEPEKFGGTLFEVEIPDDDVLLDEQKPLAEQPKKVLQGLRKTLKSLSADELRRFFQKSAYGEEEYNKIQQELQSLSILVSAPISVGRGGRFGKHALRSHGYSDEDIADFQANPERGKQETARLREEYAPRIKELKKQTRAFATRYFRNEYIMQNKTGRTFYNALAAAYESDKEASQALNKYGIEGITYVGQQDGRCFVIFNDEAIEIINKFNQRVRNANQGRIARDGAGRRVIELFESADASTFLHEMGHMFLMDLEDLAALEDEASQKDLATVDEWAAWHEGAAKDYEGSPWAEEFRAREQAILDAHAAGDVLTEKKLKEEWRHERFARGFELYLKEGKAPSSVLRSVFRKFKEFLRRIYKTACSIGARPSAKVEEVMARMVATEEEIRAASLDERYRSVEDAGGEKLFTESERETYKRWQQEAEAEAEETLRVLVMRDLEDKGREDLAERVKKEEERKREALEKEPVYMAEAAMEAGGDADVVLHWFPSREIFLEERAKRKSLEEELKEHLQAYEARLEQEMIASHFTEENIAKAMQSPEGYKKRQALEAAAYRRKERLLNRVGKKADTAMDDLEAALAAAPEHLDLVAEKDTDPAEKVHKAASRLRYSAKWQDEELKEIDDLRRAGTREEMAEKLKEFRRRAREKQKEERQRKERPRGQKQDGDWQAFGEELLKKERLFRQAAEDSLKERPLAESCNPNFYRRQERFARRVAQADMLLKKSSFMSNRINNMERDIRMDSHGLSLTDSVTEWLRDHAYRPLTWTDLLLLHVSENVVCKGKIFML